MPEKREVKPLITDDDIAREHWAANHDRNNWTAHANDFARRIESLVRKRLAERLRAHADATDVDAPEWAARIVEGSDER